MSTKEKLLECLTEKEGEFISGEEISRSLSLTRSAVWKAVEALRDDGYSIQAKTNCGYRLTTEGELSGKKLTSLLAPEKVVFLDTVDSTNRLAKQLASTGAEDGTVVVARRQSGGRGRLGRSFSSPHGGIYLSMICKPKGHGDDVLLITSAAAVATAEAIEKVTGIKCMIKWVNDLYVQGRKVTGILSEGVVDMESRSLTAVVVGIGINFCTQQADFPEDIRSVAGSLYQGPSQVPQNVDPNQLVAHLVKRLKLYESDLSMRAFLPYYRERNLLLHKEVRLYQGGEEKEGGVVIDIDDDAHLVIRKKDGGKEAVGTGEVTVRLAQPPVNRYDVIRGKEHA